MPTNVKRSATSPTFSPEAVAAALAAAPSPQEAEKVDWDRAVVTPGGGVDATLAALRRTRGPNKHPTKVQVAIRLDRDVLEAFRASGRGWQTRMNAALREWLSTHSPT